MLKVKALLSKIVNKLAIIGEQYTKTTSIAITTTGIDDHTASQRTATLSLDAGVWIIYAYAQFNTASSSGTRVVAARIYAGATLLVQERVVNAANNWCSLNPCGTITLSGTTTVYCELAATKTSTALNTTIRAVRIA